MIKTHILNNIKYVLLETGSEIGEKKMQETEEMDGELVRSAENVGMQQYEQSFFCLEGRNEQLTVMWSLDERL